MDRPVSSEDPTPAPAGVDSMGTVTGVVTVDGRPAVDVPVVPHSLDDPSPAVPELPVSSDSAGRYRWRLPPGRYVLRAGGVTSDPVTVTAGGHARVDLTAR